MKTAALARLPFLRDATPAAIAAVKRVLRARTVPAGTVLFRTGDDGDECYFVDDGELQVLTHLEGSVLASLGPGAFVGELALLLGEPRSATVTANVDSKLFVLARADLDRLVVDHPSLSLGISKELGRRILQTNRRFAGNLQARRSIVYPASKVAALAAEMVTHRRVGAAALGRGALGSLPDGVTAVKSPTYGADDTRLDTVLLGAGDSGSPAAAKVVGAAEHVLCFGAAPEWLRAAAPEHRLVQLAETPLGIRRAVRWATGRAVGMVLSSGGSKTVAHLGVLRVLSEAGVEIDAVAGSSGGSIGAVGVAFGGGEQYLARSIVDVARATQWHRLDLNIPPRSGLAKGRRLRDVFAKWDHGPNLEDGEIPIWLIGADVATGGAVIMQRGPVADAIRASLSVPGAFDPWRFEGRLLIDGAIANPLPTDVLRAAGVGIVLACNVAGQSSTVDVQDRLPGLGQLVSRIINAWERERIGALLPLADVVIRPRVSAASTFDFSGVDPIIDAGVAAAQERLPDVLALLAVR